MEETINVLAALAGRNWMTEYTHVPATPAPRRLRAVSFDVKPTNLPEEGKRWRAIVRYEGAHTKTAFGSTQQLALASAHRREKFDDD